MPSENAQDIAVYLIGRLEEFAGIALRPDPDRLTIRELWPSAPELLLELWDWCGGSDSGNPLLMIARPLVAPFPSKEPILDWQWMSLMSPGVMATWAREAAAGNRAEEPWNVRELLKHRWPKYLPFAEVQSEGAHLLCLDGEGRVTAWFHDGSEAFEPGNVEEARPIHPSFDEWMRELVERLRSGALAIETPRGRNTLVSLRDEFVLDFEGETGWRKKRGR